MFSTLLNVRSQNANGPGNLKGKAASISDVAEWKNGTRPGIVCHPVVKVIT